MQAPAAVTVCESEMTFLLLKGRPAVDTCGLLPACLILGKGK